MEYVKDSIYTGPGVQVDKEKEKPHAEKVVSGKTEVRKKTAGKRLLGEFLPDDTRSIGDYIAQEVLIPALKNLLSDMITNGMNMWLFHDPNGRDYGKKSYSNNGVNYVNYSKPQRQRAASPRAIDVDDVFFEDPRDAERVARYMINELETYGNVTVAYYCDLTGQQSDYTSNHYGWVRLPFERDMVMRLRDGRYTLNLPRPVYLD